MRYLYTIGTLVGCSLISLGSYVSAASYASYEYDQEYVSSVTWMHENGMTRYQDASIFRPNDYVMRQEAAKFFVAYVNQFMTGGTNGGADCRFMDLDSADTTLQTSIVDACTLGLFYGADGYFLPNQAMTKAQAITVLIRALEGKYDETGEPRWNSYFQRARVLGITKETNVWRLDVPVTRYEMALLLARSQDAVEGNGTPDTTEDDMSELEDILMQLGLRTE